MGCCSSGDYEPIPKALRVPMSSEISELADEISRERSAKKRKEMLNRLSHCQLSSHNIVTLLRAMKDDDERLYLIKKLSELIYNPNKEVIGSGFWSEAARTKAYAYL